MKKSVARDLVDASDALESLLATVEKMSLEDKVDAGARVRAILKNAADLDKTLSSEIKDYLDHKEGIVMGATFKATNKLVPVSRCNVTALKEADPKTYSRYLEDSEQERVSYEPR